MLLILIATIVSVWLLIQTTPVQNFLVDQVARKISKDLNTTVRIKHVNFAFFNSMLLEGTLIEDLKHDTLLYAGSVKVNITDWFFLKDKIELRYIGLDDAVIHLNRVDSVWNYHFLLDYFGNSSPSSTNKKSINLNFRAVDLHNISIVQQDIWRGEDMMASIKALTVDADEINFNKRLIRIKSFTLDQPSFSIDDYPGKRPPRIRPVDDDEPEINDPNNLRWNTGEWDLFIRDLVIKDGVFRNDRKTERAPYQSFDGSHILFSDINGSFTNFTVSKDTISSDIFLQTRERSGLDVKQLTSKLKMHPEAMEFYDLHLQTDESHLNDFFAMRYATFDDMQDFETKVRMEGNFNNAVISSDDIAFFAPELKNWKKKIEINGTVKGTVDNLNGEKLVIEAGKDTYLRGNISMSGLPDISKTYIDFEAENFRTSYKDALSLIPQLKSIHQPRLDMLEYLRFKGNFTGFLSDFVTYGTLETKLGKITTDLNMKFPEKDPTRYSGNLKTSGFDIGKLLDNKTLGKIIFEGKVNGIGLHANTINAKLDGDIHLLEFNQYPYKDITIRGNVAKSLFNGEFISDDPNLQANLNGLVDFSKEIPEFNFEAIVSKADLQKLNLLNDQVDFNGKFNVNFTGNNIDNFLGTARIFEAALYRKGQRISFDSLYVESKIMDSNKIITAVSNEFDAVLAGEFSLNDLPASFQTFLNKYYPAYIKPSKKVLNNENFSFVITTKNVEEYINLIHPDLTGFNSSTIAGQINTKENLLDLNVDIPQFDYKNISFYNLILKATGDAKSLAMQTDIANVLINDSLNFPGTFINLRSADDISDINITTSANQTLNSANISAQLRTLPTGVNITFKESDFDINGKKWIIEKDGELAFAEKHLGANALTLYSGLQEVHITTTPSAVVGANDIHIKMEKVNIGDFTPYIVKSNRIEGLLTGDISIVDPFGKVRVDLNTEAEHFRLDDDSIGHVVLKGKYYDALKEVNFNAVADNKDYTFDLQGIYHLGDSVKNENLDIFTTLKNTRINLLQQYLDGVFTDLSGFATGSLRITGPPNNLDYIGSIHLSDAFLRVKYTNVLYRIPFANVELKEDRIDFGRFQFEDQQRNTARITKGVLFHEGFNNLSFDFTMNTNKLTVLSTNNTTSDDSFYGNVVARANMTLTGPLEDMVMNIQGEPTDSSDLFINTKSSRQSDQADFVVWKVYGREMESSRMPGTSNLTVNLDVTANNYANMYVILDELTGDIIQATGRGNLKIHATTNGEFNILGRYDIDQGNYNFNFESLLKKPFRLREDVANYIQWSGDPSNATIKIEAEYEAENVRFSDLGTTIQNLSVSENVSRYRGRVLVIAALSQELLSPEISFRIELPTNSPLRNDEGAARIINAIQADQNELNKQVAFLVVFNSFGPLQTSSNQGSIANTAFEGIVVGSISGVLSNTLSRQFSNVFQKIFNDKSIRVNFNAQLYNGSNLINTFNRNAFSIDRTNLNLSIGKSLFNERLTFTFGSAVDFGLTSEQINATRNLPFLPDINAEWKVSPDGKVVLTFFYRDSYNYLARAGIRQNRSGASISYRREFEKIGDLLENRKRKTNNKEQE